MGSLAGTALPCRPFPQLAPNLAVEVLSHSNTPGEMAAKRLDYFTAGVELVWEIDPRTRNVAVYTAVDQVVTLTVGDTIDGGLVLPGFRLPVQQLFTELDRHG